MIASSRVLQLPCGSYAPANWVDISDAMIYCDIKSHDYVIYKNAYCDINSNYLIQDAN